MPFVLYPQAGTNAVLAIVFLLSAVKLQAPSPADWGTVHSTSPVSALSPLLGLWSFSQAPVMRAVLTEGLVLLISTVGAP